MKYRLTLCIDVENENQQVAYAQAQHLTKVVATLLSDEQGKANVNVVNYDTAIDTVKS